MSLIDTGWSTEEKQIVENILAQAYDRDVSLTINHVRQKVTNLTNIEELWQVHDFLSSKRYDLDGKYDSRESMLIFTLSQLIKENVITLQDLDGLTKNKLAKISSLAKM